MDEQGYFDDPTGLIVWKAVHDFGMGSHVLGVYATEEDAERRVAFALGLNLEQFRSDPRRNISAYAEVADVMKLNYYEGDAWIARELEWITTNG